MKALLKFELRKLLRNKAFFICLGIAVALITISLLINKVIFDSGLIEYAEQEIPEEYAEQYAESLSALKESFNGIMMLKNLLANTSNLLNNTLVISGITISLIVCEDFTGDTIKNIYSKGYSRTQVYFAKLVSSLIAFMAIILSGMILSFGLGSLLLDGVGPVGKNFALSIVCIFLVALAYFMIYYSIAMLFKKTAPSIVLCILGPLGLTLILELIDMVKKTDKFNVSDYWIVGVSNNLSAIDVDNQYIIAGFIVPIVIIAGFGALSYFLNEKRDVK